MYAEFKFLFEPVLTKSDLINVRADNDGDIYGRLPKTHAIFYKDKKEGGLGQVRNSIKDNIYNDSYNNDADPYLNLIDHFKKQPPTFLRPADFAYLTDLGVYPINRLIIMRRFPDGVVVPGNLLEWGNNGPEPIATVVGWVKEGADEFFNFSFGEEWKTQTQTIDKVFGEILDKEFGFVKNASKILAVPGWSQGFLWGFLANAGLASEVYNWAKTPIGDPNVLKEAMMRDIDGQGLKSDFTINFETSYEQKFINGADPSQAMQDIISNLTTFGTSKMNYYLRPNSGTVEKLIKALNGTSNTGSANYKDWVDFVDKLASAFFQGISKTIEHVSTGIFKGSLKRILKKKSKDKESDGDSSQEALDIQSFSNDQNIAGNLNTNTFDSTTEENTLENLKAGEINLLNTIIAGTVMKYRWPLKGSLAMMTGLPTTPWHITIGNPYSPILSLNNIVVNDVNLSFGTDMGFGDMPNIIKAKISLKLGRPLGKQEIDTAFNNSYRRVYSKASINQTKTIDGSTELATDNKGKAVSETEKNNNIDQQNYVEVNPVNKNNPSNNNNSQYNWALTGKPTPLI